MTVHFQVVKNAQPDCIFCGLWRSVMIRIVHDDVDGEQWICAFCARGICRALEQFKGDEK